MTKRCRSDDDGNDNGGRIRKRQRHGNNFDPSLSFWERLDTVKTDKNMTKEELEEAYSDVLYKLLKERHLLLSHYKKETRSAIFLKKIREMGVKEEELQEKYDVLENDYAMEYNMRHHQDEKIEELEQKILYQKEEISSLASIIEQQDREIRIYQEFFVELSKNAMAFLEVITKAMAWWPGTGQ